MNLVLKPLKNIITQPMREAVQKKFPTLSCRTQAVHPSLRSGRHLQGKTPRLTPRDNKKGGLEVNDVIKITNTVTVLYVHFYIINIKNR